MKLFVYLICLNGQKYKVYSKTINDLINIIEFFDFKNKVNIIEYNGIIYSKPLKKSYNNKSLYLRHEDTIEIITVVGGG